jgi:hypothetical protein
MRRMLPLMLQIFLGVVSWDACAAQLPDVRLACGNNAGTFCEITSHDDRTLIINRVVLNKRVGVRDCDVSDQKLDLANFSTGRQKLTDKPLQLGDKVTVQFAGSCGNPVVLTIYTNVGSVQFNQ